MGDDEPKTLWPTMMSPMLCTPTHVHQLLSSESVKSVGSVVRLPIGAEGRGGEEGGGVLPAIRSRIIESCGGK